MLSWPRPVNGVDFHLLSRRPFFASQRLSADLLLVRSSLRPVRCAPIAGHVTSRALLTLHINLLVSNDIQPSGYALMERRAAWIM